MWRRGKRSPSAPNGGPRARIAVDAWLDESDGAELLATLRPLLATRGVDITSRGAPPAELSRPLLLLLSDGLVAAGAGDLARVAAQPDARLVPIQLPTLTAEVPESLSSIAWITDTDPEKIAERVAVNLRSSPEWLAGWAALEAAAREHARQASGRAALLSQRELDAALESIARRPRDLLPAVPADVAALVDASRGAIRRRRRAGGAAAGAAVAILLAATAVALVQRHGAAAAAERARQTAVAAEADRLARLAVGYLGRDPDLPVMLARRAYELSATPESRASLVRALDAAPWHRSFRVGSDVFSMASSPRTRLVALAMSDGDVMVVDVSTGRTVARAVRPDGARGVPALAISRDGRSLALAYGRGLVQTRSLDRTFEIVSSVELDRARRSFALAVAWSPGGEEVITAWPSAPALRTELSTGSTRRLVMPGVASPVGLGTSADGRLLALVGRGRVAIATRGGRRPCAVVDRPTRSSSSTGGAAFGARQRVVVVTSSDVPPQPIPVPRRCGRPAGEEPKEPLWPVPTASDAGAELADGTVAIAALDGEVVRFQAPALDPVERFVAHAGAVRGIGVSRGGILVTVGSDGWLRAWQVRPRSVRYPGGAPPGHRLEERFAFDGFHSTWRPMIAVDPSGEWVSVGSPSTGLLTVARRDRHAEREFYLGGASSIRPAPTHPCSALVLGIGGTVNLVRCQDEGLETVWTREEALPLASIVHSAVSHDGHYVALSDLGDVEVTDTSTGDVRNMDATGVRALAFDRSGTAVAFSGDGTIALLPREGRPRRVRAALSGHAVRAAGVMPDGRRALLITEAHGLAIVDLADGEVVRRVPIAGDLSGAIDVRVAPDRPLAAVVARRGLWVVDLDLGRVAYADTAYPDPFVGFQPRDAAPLPSGKGFVVLRADGGFAPIALRRWRFLDGDALLEATARALPRRLHEDGLDRLPPLMLVGG